MHCKGSEDMSSRHKCLLLWVMLLWMWLFEALCEKNAGRARIEWADRFSVNLRKSPPCVVRAGPSKHFRMKIKSRYLEFAL